MGYSTTPAYRLEMRASGGTYTPSSWRVQGRGQLRGDGAPTDANLARAIERFERSTLPGGSNAHLRPTTVWSAKIVRQRDGHVMARYQGPMFAVVGSARRRRTAPIHQHRHGRR